MRKELVVYVNTNEQDEEVKVQRVTTDPEFILLTLGQNRMVLNVAELCDAIGAIGHYSTLFDQEQKMREARSKSPPAMTIPMPANLASKRATNPEEDGALILEAQVRSGPTASELALENMTKHMQGDTIVVTAKVEE